MAWAFQTPIFPVLVSFQISESKDCSQLFYIYIDFQVIRFLSTFLKTDQLIEVFVRLNI